MNQRICAAKYINWKLVENICYVFPELIKCHIVQKGRWYLQINSKPSQIYFSFWKCEDSRTMHIVSEITQQFLFVYL